MVRTSHMFAGQPAPDIWNLAPVCCPPVLCVTPQGLYLGFGKGASASAGSVLSYMWNDPHLPTITYTDTDPPVKVRLCL